jgi:hypothetical protein
MAKVFVAILTTRVDLEQLPWENAVIQAPSDLLTTSFISFGMASPPDSPDQDDLSLEGDFSTPLGIISPPVRPEWNPPSMSDSATIETTGAVIEGSSIWRVMFRVQEEARKMHLQLFHPDPTTVFVRKPDGEMYVSVIAEFQNPGQIKLNVMLHKGTDEAALAEFKAALRLGE